MKTLRPIASPLRQLSFLSRPNKALNPCISTSHRHTNHNRHPIRRTFISPTSFNAFQKTQTLTAHRTISYPPNVIYSVISDVGAYSSFLPFCRESIVTKYSSPAKDGKSYPEEATLVIGFNDTIHETFTSRVYCVPERVVEAVSGATVTSLPKEEVPHHSPRPVVEQDSTRNESVMSQLRTRWTLRAGQPGIGGAQGKTDVDLMIEFQFANPLYAAMSSAAAPKVADKMIEAFEKRVETVALKYRH